MSKDQRQDTEEKSFLSRWSRRKSEQSPSQDTGQEATVPEPVQSESASDTLPESTGESRVLTDEDMPPIESLDENSDYSLFMSEGVSEKLRRLALRKLFSGAGFNIRDGLDDYDDDFTYFEPLGDLVTSDMKHREEMKEKRRKEEEEEERRKAAAEQEAVEQDEAESPTSEEEDSPDAEPGGPEELPEGEA
ncbi:MAG: DUF3306 domain-containing protein, partial [Gammaproteobacteria bacterium]|nr:DUF3306 domain-containing protein [Gammaproteobacteria bacterium]